MRDWLSEAITGAIATVVIGLLTWWGKKNFVTHKEIYGEDERPRFKFKDDCEKCRVACNAMLLSEIAELKDGQKELGKKFEQITLFMGRVDQFMVSSKGGK